MKTIRSLLLAGATCAALTPATAFAQIEDIIVTAQKVEESLQDVPIAVTAITGEAIEASGGLSLESIGELVPSVTFRKGTTGANNALFLRGVGTITFSVAAEPSVSTVVDGIVLSRSGQAFADLIDIDRLEVLRGPQGTLFGKNASAGLINIVSKGGSDKFEGEASLSAYSGKEYRGKVSVSGPLSDTVKARVTGFYGSYAGNITNVFGGVPDQINGYKHYGVRGILDWEASSTAKIRLIMDYFKADDDCCAEVTGVTRGAVLDAELGFNNRQGENVRTVNQNLVTTAKDTQYSATLSGDFEVGTHTLSVITGYRKWRNDEVREGDYLPRAVVGTTQFHDFGRVDTKQYSGEIRLASAQDSALTYQVGAFYFRSENSQDFTRRSIRCTSSTLPVDPVTGATPCNLADTVNTLFPTATSRSDVKIDNLAGFGQATYNFSDAISLTAGLRYTNDKINFVHTRAPAINATTGLPLPTSSLGGTGVNINPAGGLTTAARPGNGTNTSRGSLSTNNLSGKVSLQIKPSEDILVYGSFTRGYKGPAFNIFFNHVAPDNAVPIDGETSDAFEIGLKSKFLDNRIQFNVALYQATYDGFQANNFINLNGAIISNLSNAGTVRTKGFEVDAIANPVDGLTFTGNLAYTDAKIIKFNPDPRTNAPNAINGTRLPLAPKWSWTVGANYETEAASFGRIYLGTTYSYSGSQFSELGQVGALDAYGLWNASLGLSDIDDKYRLTFVVRNITDTSFVNLNTGGGVRLHIPREADRYSGINFRAKF
jgi:iron complex outermembrane recepter protein